MKGCLSKLQQLTWLSSWCWRDCKVGGGGLQPVAKKNNILKVIPQLSDSD